MLPRRYMDQQSIYGLAGLAIMLVVESLFDMQLLNCRPSVVAAAILYAERRQRGAVPFWPSSLAKATGYQDMGTPELAMAVRTAQKLCRKVLYTQIYKAQAASLQAAGVPVAAQQPELQQQPAAPAVGGNGAGVDEQTMLELLRAMETLQAGAGAGPVVPPPGLGPQRPTTPSQPALAAESSPVEEAAEATPAWA
jgi:pentatricopeptide repeat domain-containing protein 1